MQFHLNFRGDNLSYTCNLISMSTYFKIMVTGSTIKTDLYMFQIFKKVLKPVCCLLTF